MDLGDSDFDIPMTPAHGDLHLGNLVVDEGRCKLTDWANFRERSSFFFDAVHFYHAEICSRRGMRWHEVPPAELAADRRVEALAEPSGLTPLRLVLAHSLNRVFLEVAQLGGVARLGPKHRQRAAALLPALLSAVLCSPLPALLPSLPSALLASPLA
jgi:hypothetical protein